MGILPKELEIISEPRNILKGISREYIFELSKQLGFECIEKNIEVYDVMMADEAFMTGTPFCLLPVTSINSNAIANRKMGPVTKLLLDTWSDNVGLNIIDQIKFYSKIHNTDTKAPSPYNFKK